MVQPRVNSGSDQFTGRRFWELDHTTEADLQAQCAMRIGPELLSTDLVDRFSLNLNLDVMLAAAALIVSTTNLFLASFDLQQVNDLYRSFSSVPHYIELTGHSTIGQKSPLSIFSLRSLFYKARGATWRNFSPSSALHPHHCCNTQIRKLVVPCLWTLT